MRYTGVMYCLRCENEALPGKALCEQCFASHQKQSEFEGTEEWVKQKLEATRNESRSKQRDGTGTQTSAQSLVLTLAPALLIMGGLLMLSVWLMRSMSMSSSKKPNSAAVQGAAEAAKNVQGVAAPSFQEWQQEDQRAPLAQEVSPVTGSQQ